MPTPLRCATALACLAVAGCGAGSTSSPSSGSSASSGGSAKVDQACHVLTAKIAGSLLGGSAHRTRKATPNPHTTQCVYNSKTGGSIAILVGDWAFMKQFSSAGKLKPISGVGKEAYETTAGVMARGGDEGVTVTAFKQSGSFSGAAATRANAQGLAFERKVAKRLVPRL